MQVLVILVIFKLILSNDLLSNVIILILWVSSFLTNVIASKYSSTNGIYKNGIINNEYIPWNKVFSYRVENNNDVSFTFEDGNVVTYQCNDKVSDVINNIKGIVSCKSV